MAVYIVRKMIQSELMPESVANAAAETLFAEDQSVSVWYRIGERRKALEEHLLKLRAGKYLPSQVDAILNAMLAKFTLIDNWLLSNDCSDLETVVFEPLAW